MTEEKLYLEQEAKYEKQYGFDVVGRDHFLQSCLRKILNDGTWLNFLFAADWNKDGIYKIYFNLSGNKCNVWFSTNPYFKSLVTDCDIKHATIYNSDMKDPTALSIISFIIDKDIMKNIKSPLIYPKFVKWFFKHANDIIYWANKYNIIEVFTFIGNLFTLRVPEEIHRLSAFEYVKLSGREFFMNNILDDQFIPKGSLENYLNKYNEIHKDKPIEGIIELFFGKTLGKDFIYRREAKIIVINLRKNFAYFGILDSFPETDLSLLFKPNQSVYSHFLWTHTNAIKHKYKLSYQKIPDIEFYNNMLAIGKLLPGKLEKMLIANLHIMLQNI